MSAVFDFNDIGRRMVKRPQPTALDDYVARFEATFQRVEMGPEVAIFQDENGAFHPYVEILSDKMPTAAAAAENWFLLMAGYAGKRRLLWRIRPELGQDTNKEDFATMLPNPDFGIWRVYARFGVLP